MQQRILAHTLTISLLVSQGIVLAFIGMALGLALALAFTRITA